MYEFYLCLVRRFIQGRANSVMPPADNAARGLHDVKDLERNGHTISARRVSWWLQGWKGFSSHNATTFRFRGVSVCALDHEGTYPGPVYAPSCAEDQGAEGTATGAMAGGVVGGRVS
jgi:hypothetical protein